MVPRRYVSSARRLARPWVYLGVMHLFHGIRTRDADALFALFYRHLNRSISVRYALSWYVPTAQTSSGAAAAIPLRML